jgi:hypothetical protein
MQPDLQIGGMVKNGAEQVRKVCNEQVVNCC